MHHSKAFIITSWALRGIAAVILLQTLFFKFTGAKESVYIFTTVGNWLGLSFMEPWGRIGSGVAELIAAVLLLLPQTAAVGGLLSLGVISGAIFFHLTALGISLPAVDDHGELFALAVIVFLCSAAVLIMHRDQLSPARINLPAFAAKR
jgi:putative oxidoreductase